MDIARIARHLLMTEWRVRRAFPAPTLAAVGAAITAAEAGHRGEIRFVVEGALHPWPLLRGQTSRERAIEVFSHQRVWDTEHNNGVLIYLLFADRIVEIVADRGVHARVGRAEWEAICSRMQDAFSASSFEQGAVEGIGDVAGALRQHYPARGGGGNELPDAPVVL